jgi:hypothetical protein
VRALVASAQGTIVGTNRLGGWPYHESLMSMLSIPAHFMFDLMQHIDGARPCEVNESVA